MTDSTETTLQPTDVIPSANKGVLARALAVRHDKEMGRFTRFLVVGTIGAVIDYGIYTGLNTLRLFNQVHLTLPMITITGVGIAGAFGFTCAVISNFVWNRYWTYPDSRSKPVTTQLITFFAVNVVGLLIRTPVIEFLHRPLGALAARVVPSLTEEITTWLGESGAWAIAVIIVLFWNFFVNRYWTYNDVK